MKNRVTQKTHALAGIALLIAIAILSLGNSANPPNGNTGAPGEGLCSSCHTLNGGNQNGNIVINGFPATITANQTYSLTVTVANPNGIANEAGFQMVILDQNNMNAGTMSNAGANSTITLSGGRSYHEHNPSQQFPGSNLVTWTVDWTAPAGSGTISYYAAGNVANGNNSNTGDLIVTTSGSGALMTPLAVMITDIQDVSCNGADDGSLTAMAQFGMPGYTYSWSNGGSGTTIAGLAPGTYTVTATDNAGATATASAAIAEPPIFEIISSTVTHVTCPGGNDGSIEVVLGGGTPPYPGANGNIFSLTGLMAGTYNVTPMDANGCLVSQEFTVNEPPALTLEVIAIVDPDCNGNASGQITVEAMGGTAPLEYNWSNGGVGPSQQNLQAGTYSVTVTDDHGCTVSEIVQLNDPELLVVELVSIEHVSCAGAMDGAITVAGAGGTGEITYDWSTGAQTPTVNNLAPGSYTVTISDDNGCTDAAMYEILEPAILEVEITGTQMVLCFGGNEGVLMANVSGGSNPYTYTWSNGQTSPTISGLGAGTYTVTVVDQNGCTTSSSTQIAQPTELMANASSTGETAPGAMDGTAASNPSGGTPGYSFLWSNGATTGMITGLAVGIYTVTVTDVNGCTDVQSVTVSGTNCTLEATVDASVLLCAGDMNGTATAIISGAIGTVNVLWSTGDTTVQVSGLGAGAYTVTITDDGGCAAIATGAVTEPAPLNATCNVMHESAPGANDGSITCLAGGGVEPYEYLWSTGATTPEITGLAPGTYFLTITDLNGCSLVDTAIVNAFVCSFPLTVSVDPVSCFGGADGSALVVPSGGTEPYTYLWSNGATTPMITDLAAGSYQVTVMDMAGCVSELNASVPQPDALVVSVDSIAPVSAGDDGAIFVTISGGTAPYSVVWTLNGIIIGTTADISGLSPGDYVIDVTDANGCVLSMGQVTVTISTGVHDVDLRQSIRVWPNPVSDRLFIDIGNLTDIRLFVLSPNGEVMASETRQEIQQGHVNYWISLQEIPSGVYFVQVIHHNGSSVIPIVKLD